MLLCAFPAIIYKSRISAGMTNSHFRFWKEFLNSAPLEDPRSTWAEDGTSHKENASFLALEKVQKCCTVGSKARINADTWTMSSGPMKRFFHEDIASWQATFIMDFPSGSVECYNRQKRIGVASMLICECWRPVAGRAITESFVGSATRIQCWIQMATSH